MQSRLKPSIQPKKFTAMLAIICALFGAAVIFISDFMIIPLAAVYAALLWFDQKNKLWAALLPLLILALSVLGGIATVFSVASGFCAALIVYFMYKANASKPDTALALTAFFAFYLLFSLFIAISAITKEYSIASAFEYYGSFMETQRAAFVDAFSQLTVTDQNGEISYLITEENAELLFLSMARLSIAFIVIIAFILGGLTLKIFSKIVTRAEADETHIRSWRFMLPSIYAYFYGFIFIFSFLLGNGDGIAAMAVQNLTYIFMAMFGYIGLMHLISISSQMRRKYLFLFFVFFSFVLLSISALQILSFLGAYVSILYNRFTEQKKQ